MSVHAYVVLRKDVDDLDKADDWFAELVEILQEKTTCSFQATSQNHEPLIEITEEPESE